MVKSSDLQNRAVIEGPAPGGADEVTEATRKMKPPKLDASAELLQVRERIEHARSIKAPRGSCCGHCYGEGTAAVLRILDGDA